MKPSPETIAEFRRLYTEEFGEELTDQEAYDRFLRLVNVVRVVYGYRPKKAEPMTGSQTPPVDHQP